MLKKNNILFSKNLVYEDEKLVLKVIYYAEYLKFLNEYIYVHRKKDSITDNKDITCILNAVSII